MLTRAVPPPLLPPCVRQVAVGFRPDELTGDAASSLGVVLSEDLRRSVPRRRAEYIAGRHCALEAIRALRPDFAGDIPSDDRAPRWPEGIVGSITHTAGFAWAAVAPGTELRSLGIDSEPIPTPARTESIRRFVGAGDTPPPSVGTLEERIHYGLVFSAKESVFKCLYPLVRRMFGYRDASVACTREPGTFRATLLLDLSVEFLAGTVLEGRHCVAEGRVSTAVTLVRPEARSRK